MKNLIISLVVLLMFWPGLGSCSTDNPEQPQQTGKYPSPSEPETDNEDDNNPPMSNQLTIRIGSATFGMTLETNAAAIAFKALLPLRLNMGDHNGNEKYDYLSTNLPTSPFRPGTIHTGDLMLFGSNCLVLFYETFSSSYSYTRLGRVDNPSGLASALGRGSATITFEITNI